MVAAILIGSRNLKHFDVTIIGGNSFIWKRSKERGLLLAAAVLDKVGIFSFNNHQSPIILDDEDEIKLES